MLKGRNLQVSQDKKEEIKVSEIINELYEEAMKNPKVKQKINQIASDKRLVLGKRQQNKGVNKQ